MKNYGKKAVSAAIVASMMLASNSMLASAAWSKDSSNIWSWTEDGKKATGWAKINGSWYYFDGNGKMKTGWIQDNTGAWFYMNSNGAMKTGWLKDGSKWYFLKGNGAMQTGWLKQNSKWYYMNKSGAMQSGFYTVKDKTYYSSADGAMQNGVVEINKEIYYFDESGSMATGKVKIGKTTYTFGEDGKLTSSVKPPIDASFNSSGSATTPTPARPTGGGGGGGYYPSTPEKPVAGPATITADNYGSFDWNKTYSTVTIDKSGMFPGDTYNFDKLNASNVIVTGSTKTRTAIQPTLIFSNTITGSIDLQTPVDIGGTTQIVKITISCVGTIAIAAPVRDVESKEAATIEATGTIGNVAANAPITIGGTGVQNVTASANVTLAANATIGNIVVPATSTPTITAETNATVNNVVANGPTTLAGAGTFTAAEIKTEGTLAVSTSTTVSTVAVSSTATAASITGGGSVGVVTADAKTTIAVAKVTDVNTTKDVVVADTSKVGSVNVTDTALVNVKVDGKVEAITKPAGGNVTTNGSTTADVPTPVAAGTVPVLTTDYTLSDASVTTPTAGSLKKAGSATLQYLDAGEWKDLSSEITKPGTYSIRRKAVTDDGGKVTTGASIAKEVTIKAYTGLADSKYYLNSVLATGWYLEKYYDTGVLQVSKWVAKDGKNIYLDKDGVNQGDFGLYAVKGGVSSITGTTTAMEYALTKDAPTWTACTAGTTSITEAKAGAYYVRMKVDTNKTGVEAQKVSVNVTVANMPEAPTGLKGVAAETATGDSLITGTTVLMEYTDDLTKTWAPCTDKETNLGASKSGTYYVRVKEAGGKPAGKVTTVVVPVYAAKTSSMGIAQMTAEEYATINWAGKPTLAPVTVGGTGSALKLTGELPYVTGFTGFDGTSVKNQSGHYAAIKIVVPEAVKAVGEVPAKIDGIKVTYTSEGGTEDGFKTITAANFDTATECYYIARVDGRMTTPITFEVDFDGDGDDYAPATYTLDFSGLTLSPLAEGTTLDVSSLDALKAALNGGVKAINVTANIEIPEDDSIVISAGTNITFEENMTLTNNGTIVVNDEDGLRVAATANAATGVVKLGSDISVDAVNAMTSRTNAFTGTLDGNNKTVTVTTSAAGTSKWLSHYTRGTTVVKNVNVKAAESEVIGFFEVVEGESCTFENVHILAGNCMVSKSDNNESAFLTHVGTAEMTFTGCTTALNYIATENNTYLSPFIGGYAQNDSSDSGNKVYFTNCVNTGNVTLTYASLFIGNGSQNKGLTVEVTDSFNKGKIKGTDGAAAFGAVGSDSLPDAVKALNTDVTVYNQNGGTIEKIADLTGFAIALEEGKLKITTPTDENAIASIESYNLCFSAYGAVTYGESVDGGTLLFNVPINILPENLATDHAVYTMIDRTTAETDESIDLTDATWVDLGAYDMKYAIVGEKLICDYGTYAAEMYPELEGVKVTLNRIASVSVTALDENGALLASVNYTPAQE